MPEITEFLLDLQAQVLSLRLQGLVLLDTEILIYHHVYIFQFPLSEKKLILVADLDNYTLEFGLNGKSVTLKDIETSLLQY